MNTLANLLLILFFVFIASLSAICQTDRIKEIYTQNVISVHGSNDFIRNDQFLKPKEAYSLLNGFDDSAFELTAYKKYRTTEKILVLPALGFLVAAMTTQKNDNSLTYIFVAASVSFAIANIVFSEKAEKHLHRSVWLYNRDVIAKQYQKE